MKKAFASFLMVSTISCVLLCQKSPTSTGDSPSATVITSLALVNGEITGWNVDTTGMSDPSDTTGSGNYRLLYMKDSITLMGKIDGGATEYEHQVSGYSGFLLQYMYNSSQSLTIYMVNYSNSSNAAGMFNYKKTGLMDMISIGSYSQTTAIADTTHITDIWAYAHFKQYYIELRFLGFTDQAGSKQAAISFLNDFQAKIK
jgi:hypothetical protein